MLRCFDFFSKIKSFRINFEQLYGLGFLFGKSAFVKVYPRSSLFLPLFRPGKSRCMSDEAVKEKLAEIDKLYRKTLDGIERYENE